MKKYFFICLAVLVLPLAFLYGVCRYIYLNRGIFAKMIDYRHLLRLQREYQRKYNYFQMELVKDEN